MKEIVLFTSAQQVDTAIQRLGEFGVIDVKEISKPTGQVLQRCIKDIEHTKNAITILKAHKASKNKRDTVITVSNSKDPKRIVNRILKSQSIKEQAQNVLKNLKAQMEFYEVWGKNIALKDIEELKKKGVHIRLYRLEKTLVKTIPETHNSIVLNESGGKLSVVLLAQDPFEKLNFKEEQLPELPFVTLDSQVKRKERQLAKVDVFLNEQQQYYSDLQAYLCLLEDRLNSETVLRGMGSIEGKVKYLRGYLPKNTIDDFTTLAKAQQWAYTISEPKHIDEVPVYIKNPKWIRMINPIMKFIDIIPGYKELDVSVYFLFAFALFFAMLVGDAGYGLIFLVLSIVFRKKITSELRILMYVLSGSTIVWGVLSGTYFGAQQIAQLPFLEDFVVPNIASFGVDNIVFMMHLSFTIGALHLTLAHVIRAVQFINSVKVLSEMGWICLVWGLFFITEQLVLGASPPKWYKTLFIVGALLVICFSRESKGFFKSMGVSIANLPLSLINGFSDIVSYVRLFAVGMATAAVAASFNTMALPDGIAGLGFVDMIMAAIALLLGHTLNIALALMAVMVHGIRLNMLEFAGHLGIQFSGEAYKPFKLIAFKHNFKQQQKK